MLTAFKVAFLFIGTSIGAGFSSGREIALFFGTSSPWCVALSALFISALSALFLTAGKLKIIPNGYGVKVATFISASISLCSMLAGSEYVLKSLSGVPLLGIAMAIAGGVVVVMGIEKIKWANTIMIPLLVVLLFTLYFKIGAPVYSGDFNLLKSLHYSGLDVLLGGIMLSREGEKLTKKEIILSATFICVFMFAILFVLQNVVLSDDLHSSMPVLAVSTKVGLKWASGVLIAIAIFTTLISALEIVSVYTADFLSTKKRLSALSAPDKKTFLTFGALLIFYPISFLGFEKIVDTFYPFTSACGLILVGLIILRLVIESVKKGREKARFQSGLQT